MSALIAGKKIATLSAHRVTEIKSDGKVEVLDAATGRRFSYQLVAISDGTDVTLALAGRD